MPMVLPEGSMIGRNRRDGRQRNHDREEDNFNSETDLSPSIVNPTRSKPTISALFLNTFSPPENPTSHKKKSFTSATFGGLGCTASASSQVSVPAVIRTSANWEAKNVKKKKKVKGNKNKATFSSSVVSESANVNGLYNNYNNNNNSLSSSSGFSCSSSSCVTVPDVWCGPGIGLSTDAASVDYVVPRRPVGRGKVDGEKMSYRERPSCSVRRMVNPEDNPFTDYDAAVRIQNTRLDAFGHYLNSQNQNSSPEGLAEIAMLESRLLLGGRLDGLDRYRDLRLDVDNMSYEELLELGDKIGHVSTGLREDEINTCLKNVKPSNHENFSLILSESERKCSICQEDFEGEDEIGKLKCRHFYHIQCIKQWLQHKNTCPVCKTGVKS